MNAWEIHHRRTDALRDVVTTLDAGGDLPWSPSLAELFADRDGLLLALHDLFARRLAGRIDLALELHDIPEASIPEAWQAVADELPGVHRLLQTYADEPALARANAHLHRTVAVAAGLVALDAPLATAAAAGRAFLARSSRFVVPARRDGWLRERLSFALMKATA
ncbi:hypothetical protein GCM10011584_31430 [Nocardioides phosphati]|uniref:DUF222 domain-containing protein n=1 Tax=Nocardioides phosphati TaxID=1867775 RepID=A0ABQ2NIS7_9ACTN|nr:hypothetical protein [Nocardioides phosphati]GGO93223.1 hypothetical protein GCM10011584_31430 [Nocardioides phosphati]